MNRHASMNRIYRLVWSESLNAYVPAAETARGRGKKSSRKLVAATLFLSTSLAQAGPTGGAVTGGSGTITQSGATTTIQQSSENLSLNWLTFNIAPQETVDFVQPNTTAVAVNRILGTNGSLILGHLNANGQIYLVNPNGVIFGKGAEVNVGGLVASTLALDSASGGATQTFAGIGSGSVINAGTLTANNGGAIALLGNHVSNTGVISAQLGTVALGAGSAATLTFHGSSLVSMQIDQSVLNSVAANGGLIRADGGRVLMTAGAAKSLLASVVNNTGVIEARTLENHEGTITLLGSMTAGTVNVGGTLDAGAPSGGSGGFIETSAEHVEIASTAKVGTAAAMGLNGTWLIDPTDFTISASGGDETGAQLSSALGLGNVILRSSNGASGSSGNINVDDVVTWSANTLTLNAQNDVNINSTMNGSGTASLALQYGQGAVNAGNLSVYNVNAAVNLPAGAHFSTQLGSDGGVTNFTVVDSLGVAADATGGLNQTLQGVARGGNSSGDFALGANIDAAATSGWNSGGGFAPIGNFSGIFDGLGHSISNLVIYKPATITVGLFDKLATTGIVRNVGLDGGSVTGGSQVGSLVGINYGLVDNTHTSAAVASGNLDSGGLSYAGGLVGFNYGGTVTYSSATGNVQATGAEVGGLVGVSHPGSVVAYSYATGAVSGTNFTGGLVGRNGGTIDTSYATGSVTSTGSGAILTGGLAGSSYGTVTNSYATGSVQGSNYVGGLIGGAGGTVSNSYATGTVHGSNYVGGLIGVSGAQITNSYATGNVSGSNYVGGLAGSSYGGSHATGSISNSHATGNVTGVTDVGGLVGYNYGGIVSGKSYASGNVSGTAYVGGLVGYSQNYGSSTATITQTYATGSVTGTGTAGGLVGYNGSGAIIDTSYAAGVVTGGTQLGGLAGINNGSISNSHATGAVTGPGSSNSVGGLVGQNYGAVTTSYATGSVTGGNYTGGLIGQNGGPGIITTSFAIGSVSGGRYTGGLVGWNYGSISNSYATGGVTGSLNVGGLVGMNGTGSGLITNSYASGVVSGGNFVGALVGANYGTLSNSFYSSARNPSLTGVGADGGNNPDVAGTVMGLTGAQLQTQANFTSATAANGNVNPSWDFTTSWFMYEGETAPLLRAFMTPLTVSGTITQTYDGAVFAPTIGALTYSSTPDFTHIFGSVTLSGNALGAENVGTYSYTPSGVYSDQLGYIFTFQSSTLTITPASLTVVGSTANKVYDGTTVAPLTGGTLVGLFGSDAVSLTQGGTFASKNAGTGIAVTATDSLSGAGAGNYVLVEPTGLTGSITPATLTVSGTAVGGKVYDGTTTADLSGGSLVGLIGGDAVTLTQAGTFASKNAGTGIAVSADDSLSGTNAADYTLVEPTGLTGSITPASLTVSGTTVGSKVYDGTNVASLTGGVLLGVVSGDTVTLNQSGTFASTSTGTAIAVTATDTLSGASAQDYSIAEPTGLVGSILPNSNGLLLAAQNARTQIVENFIYPQLGASPQIIDASPTITALASSADEAGAATGWHEATTVNVSMKIGATGTLKIENGGLRLPSNLVVGNE